MSNPDIAADFVARNGEKKVKPKSAPKGLSRSTPLEPGKGLDRGKELARGSGPKKTFKQKILDAKWAALKDAFIYLFDRLHPDGAHCEECGVPGNAKTLDLDHIQERSKGGAYKAFNARLLCNRFNVHGEDNCHDRRHGNQPKWSKAS